MNIFTSFWFAHGMHHLSRNAILACRLIYLSKMAERPKSSAASTFPVSSLEIIAGHAITFLAAMTKILLRFPVRARGQSSGLKL